MVSIQLGDTKRRNHVYFADKMGVSTQSSILLNVKSYQFFCLRISDNKNKAHVTSTGSSSLQNRTALFSLPCSLLLFTLYTIHYGIPLTIGNSDNNFKGFITIVI